MAQDSITGLLRQVSDVIAATDVAAAKYLERAQDVYDASGMISWGVLGLGFSLLTIYELGQSDRGPRIGFILLRLGVVLVLLLEYDRVVTLITGVAGGGSFGEWDDLMGWAGQAIDLGMDKWDGVFEIHVFIFWFGLILILLAASLLSYVVALGISLSQGVLITIALTLGKLAISVSVAPGVSMAKSWAKFLAMVAAWSTVGSTVVGLLDVSQGQIFEVIEQNDVVGVLKLSGRYIVLAFALGSTPWITAALFNGVAAMAPGFSQSMGLAKAAVSSPSKMAARRAAAARRERAAARGGKQSGGGSGGGGGGGGDRTTHSRVHKVVAREGPPPPVRPENRGGPKGGGAKSGRPGGDPRSAAQTRAASLDPRAPLSGGFAASFSSPPKSDSAGHVKREDAGRSPSPPSPSSAMSSAGARASAPSPSSSPSSSSSSTTRREGRPESAGENQAVVSREDCSPRPQRGESQGAKNHGNQAEGGSGRTQSLPETRREGKATSSGGARPVEGRDVPEGRAERASVRGGRSELGASASLPGRSQADAREEPRQGPQGRERAMREESAAQPARASKAERQPAFARGKPGKEREAKRSPGSAIERLHKVRRKKS